MNQFPIRNDNAGRCLKIVKVFCDGEENDLRRCVLQANHRGDCWLEMPNGQQFLVKTKGVENGEEVSFREAFER